MLCAASGIDALLIAIYTGKVWVALQAYRSDAGHDKPRSSRPWRSMRMPFEYVLIVVLSLQLALHFALPSLYMSLFWAFAVGYAGSNHFLFGLHLFMGKLAPLHNGYRQLINITAGTGGLLKGRRTFMWGFDSHRLMDVVVHFGMALQIPWRVDHWVLLVLHVMKYCGMPVEAARQRVTFFGLAEIQVDDLFDVLAHSASALYTLGVFPFVSFLLFAELQRAFLMLTK
mmetsp:Transcript_3833/g.10032  ORF Transcript_3833/g.10032 Transcript_3833/m.10032 type:complete len:228 (-) Transcript_3833:156-839(-)